MLLQAERQSGNRIKQTPNETSSMENKTQPGMGAEGQARVGIRRPSMTTVTSSCSLGEASEPLASDTSCAAESGDVLAQVCLWGLLFGLP